VADKEREATEAREEASRLGQQARMLKAEASRGLCTAAEATKKEAEAKRLFQQELVHMTAQVAAQREEIEARN
jgi:DNA polymerase sigma